MGADQSVEDTWSTYDESNSAMGSRQSKGPTLEEALRILSPGEQADLSAAFDQLTADKTNSKPKTKEQAEMFDFAAFKNLVSGLLPLDFAETLFKVMCKCSEKVKDSFADRKGLFVTVALLVKGSVPDKAKVYVLMGSGGDKHITSDQLHHMTCSLISAALHSKHLNPRAVIWGGQDKDSNARLARVFLDDATFRPEQGNGDKFTASQLSDWMVNHHLVIRLFEAVFRSCFFSASDLSGDEVDSAARVAAQAMGEDEDDHPNDPLLPVILKHHMNGPSANETASHSLLDSSSVLFINHHIPRAHRHLWRQLFSSSLHGESFSSLLKYSTGRGPTVLLVQDTDDHVFGGFASTSWEISSNFIGDEHCFLFSLKPEMKVYRPTGYNNHYMYLNHGMQTMPNGLGMGGQHGYFGLFLDHEYGRGHSKAHPHSTTYHSPQLSNQDEFQVKHIEVWAVGLPVDHHPVGKGSILDSNLDVQALMEMVTGKPVSGLYEPKLVDDDNDDED